MQPTTVAEQKPPRYSDRFKELQKDVGIYLMSDANHAKHLYDLARIVEWTGEASNNNRDLFRIHVGMSRAAGRKKHFNFFCTHDIRARYARCCKKTSQRAIKLLEKEKLIAPIDRVRLSNTKTINYYQVQKVFENLVFLGDTPYLKIDNSITLLTEYLEQEISSLAARIEDRKKIREETKKCPPNNKVFKYIKKQSRREKSPELKALIEELKRGIVASDSKKIIKFKLHMPERLLSLFPNETILKALDKMEELPEKELREIKYFVAYLIRVCINLLKYPDTNGRKPRKEFVKPMGIMRVIPKVSAEEAAEYLAKRAAPHTHDPEPGRYKTFEYYEEKQYVVPKVNQEEFDRYLAEKKKQQIDPDEYYRKECAKLGIVFKGYSTKK